MPIACLPANTGSKRCGVLTKNKLRLFWVTAHFIKKGLLNKLIRWETFHTLCNTSSYALAGMAYRGGDETSVINHLFQAQRILIAQPHTRGDDDLFHKYGGHT